MLTILDAIRDPQLFAPWFKDRTTWPAWLAFLAALFGLPMDAEAEAIYREHTGRETAPTEPASEAWVMAVEMGDVDVVKPKLRTLREERAKLSADRARTAGSIPTIEELMPVVKAKLADLRATLESDVAQGRMALGALLGEDRLRIYADGQIEGAAWLDAEMKLPAPRGTSKPGDSVVAGGRYARVSRLPGPLALPVEGSLCDAA